MKPYVIVTGDFRRTGGMDMANFALASFLARRGVEVHLVAHHVAAELSGHPGVQVHRVPKPAGSYFLGGPLLDRAGRRWARQAVRRGGRVVVNGGNCLWGDVNWVHYVHAAYAPQLATSRPRRWKAALERRQYLRDERRAIRRARLVLANSERTRRDLIDRLGVPEARVRTVYYGIDGARFGPIAASERAAARAERGWSHERPIVVFIGALGDRRKGFDTLFAAWTGLCADPAWDAELAVIGSGAEAPDWRRRAAAAGLDGRVHFLGFIDEVPRTLAACDLLVHPARYEAYGLGVHEALCRDLPAIVSAAAGVAERYPSELRPLLLDDPEDVPALAERLRVWHRDRDRFRSSAARWAETLRSRTWDDMAEEIFGLMESEVPGQFRG